MQVLHTQGDLIGEEDSLGGRDLVFVGAAEQGAQVAVAAEVGDDEEGAGVERVAEQVEDVEVVAHAEQQEEFVLGRGRVGGAGCWQGPFDGHAEGSVRAGFCFWFGRVYFRLGNE